MSAADWKPYDVPGLAGLLAEQPTDAGTHAMAWQQAYETLTDQRERIEAARVALTQAWPATPGSAAGSFFDQVDALTQAMSATAESAVNAHGALTGIVTAVDGATTKVDTLHQSWQQNQATIADVVPTDDWTQPLNDQAHTAMGQADAAIAEHATQLAPPVPYSPPNYREQVRVISNRPKGQSANNRAPKAATGRPQANPSTTIPMLTADGTGVTTTPRIAATGASPTQGGADPVSGSQHAHQTATAQLAAPMGTESTSNRGFSKTLRTQSVPEGSVAGSAGSTNEPQTLHNMNGAGKNASVRTSTIDVGTSTLGRESSTSEGGRFVSGATTHASTQFVDTVGERGSAPLGRLNNQSAHASPPIDDSLGGSGDVSAANVSSPTRSAEPVAYGGLLGGGMPIPSGGASSSGRRARGEVSTWAMPVGVPAVIKPGDEVQIYHDPGPGVIGIDL